MPEYITTGLPETPVRFSLPAIHCTQLTTVHMLNRL